MANESLTISTAAPAKTSMQYETLREAGIEYLQELAGKIWTDYNSSDSGVAMLEALCYAITDLGYRTSFRMKDLLASDPGNPDLIDLKNFYTARKIMHNCPVTFDDYRKLLIDVEVYDPFNPDCEFAGIKNAWINTASGNEHPIYVHRQASKLSYEKDPEVSDPDQEILDLRILYDVLLEFDKCDAFGDLNQNTLSNDLIIYSNPDDELVEGLTIRPSIVFPRWDAAIDWSDLGAIKEAISTITLSFFDAPRRYEFDYTVDDFNNVVISGTRPISGTNNREPIPGLNQINSQLTAFLYDFANPDSMIRQYQAKVFKVQEILDEVKATMCANRNLSEDVLSFSALKVEEIAVCADIEVDVDANIDEVQAKIYFLIAEFLNPTVYFYSLDEMLAKGYTTDEIFEGPRLEHGFIDDEELAKANRADFIHVSDLIQIIHDVPGVRAVNSIQIANLPQNNVDNITTKSVRWCLKLAFEQNYVPRLSIDRSKITFFKDNLPFKADELEVERLVDELEDNARPQKLQDAKLDIPVPQGVFRDVSDYQSVQSDFPLNYGIGEAGLPSNASIERQAYAKQLKGYLMFFDQILADYLAQLDNIKYLFSMNGERDADGKFVIDKTYFTQTLVNSVPNVIKDNLYIDEPGHSARLQKIAESEKTFLERRNRFLDHLLARFSESFSDYALLAYRIDGPAGQEELIEDKLRFLDRYPELSSGRGKGFNYCSPCDLWSVDNTAGVTKRATLLTGMDDRLPETLAFSPNIRIIDTGLLPNPYRFEIDDNGGTTIMTSPQGKFWSTLDNIKLALERVVLNGACEDRYVVEAETGDRYSYRLYCDEEELAESVDKDFLSEAAAVGGIDFAVDILKEEFFNNPLANRNNLTCPFEVFFDKSISAPDMLADPPSYTIELEMYPNAFDFSGTPLLTSTLEGEGEAKKSIQISGVSLPGNSFQVEAYLVDTIKPGDVFLVEGSDGNDVTGGYTVDTVTYAGNWSFVRPLESISSDTAPFGDLFYNPQSEAEVMAQAEVECRELMLQIASQGRESKNYELLPDEEPYTDYHFDISNGGAVLATSVATDFNTVIATELANTQGNNFTVTGSTNNDGAYTLDLGMGTQANGPNVIVYVNETIPDTVIFDGNLGYTNGYSYTGDQAAQTLTFIGADLTGILRAGDVITIVSSSSNNGSYTINKVELDGADTTVRVNEEIPSDNFDGTLTYTRSFPIVAFNLTGGNAFVVKGGADDLAISDMVTFMQEKFFNHEGMHVIEHLLLRPKVNERLFVPCLPGDLIDDNRGIAVFNPVFPISRVTKKNNTFCIKGDWVNILKPVRRITVSDSKFNDGSYRITNVTLDGGRTCIEVFPDIIEDCVVDGNLTFRKIAPIANVDADTKTVVLYSFNDVLPFLNLLLEQGILGNGSIDPYEFEVDLTDVTEFIDSSAYDADDACECRPKANVSYSTDNVTGLWQLVIKITDQCGYDCTLQISQQSTDSGDTPFSNLVRFEAIEESANPGMYNLIGQYLVGEEIQLLPMDSSLPCFDITISEGDECWRLLQEGMEFRILRSTEGLNNGTYTIDQFFSDPSTRIIIRDKLKLVQDCLLPIYLDEDCAACQNTDPYSCIVTVVAPYWQGRFSIPDFRNFFERTVRLEMPAHIAMNICVVGCEDMMRFEHKYKAWLLEQAKAERDEIALSNALCELVEVLGDIRNVYPGGRLHDCNDDDDFSNSVILNNTILGNA